MKKRADGNKILFIKHEWLSHKRAVFYIICISMLFLSPALWMGFHSDDLIHRALLIKELSYEQIVNNGLLNSVNEMFSFTRGDSLLVAYGKNSGVLPWWTSDHFDINLLRPLTELTHRLDYFLWPDSPVAMHVHSLLWMVAIILVLSSLYRRKIQTGWIAGLATLLFAISSINAIPVAWLANRNSMVALFFGVSTLLVHDRWRSDRWAPGAFLGPVFLVMGFLAGEAALATCAYLFSYMFFIDKDTVFKRLLSMVPYGVIFVLWALIYKIEGFGSHGSGMYINPMSDPGIFINALLDRLPILLAGQWVNFIADFYAIFNVPLLFKVFSFSLLGVLVIILSPILREDPVARFWALGMVLSLIPVCASFPSSRHLIFSGIGAMGLIAQMVGAYKEREGYSVLWQKTARVFVPSVMAVHLVMAPVITPVSIKMFKDFFVYHAAVPSLVLPISSNMAATEVVLVNPPSPHMTSFMWRYRNYKGLPNAAGMRVLTSGVDFPLEIHRKDANTLVIKKDAGLNKAFLEDLFYNPFSPFQANHKIELHGLAIKINSVTKESYPDKIELISESALTPNVLHMLKEQFAIPAGNIVKVGGHTVEVQLDEVFQKRYYDSFRHRGVAVKPGSSLKLPSWDIEVLSMNKKGFPTEAVFHFSLSLESRAIVFLRWQEGGYVPFQLPAIGETAILKGESMLPW